jgi:DNA-binding transcriptional LysR family regulator
MKFKYHFCHAVHARTIMGCAVTLSQLRILLAVADHGGFTTAAERIQSTQPAVSRAVSALEHELRTTLFTRHRDGVTPTEAGAAAIRHAREALRCLERLTQDVSAASGRLSGTLRLASLPSATGTLLAGPMRDFTGRHPEVSIRLFEGTDQEIRDWITQGAADIGVVTLPAPGFDCVELGGDEMVAVLPARHALAGHASVTFAQLAAEPFVFPTGGCGPLITAAARRAGVALDVTLEARDPQAIVEMVAAELGVSVMPTLNLPRRPPGIATRPLEPRLPRRLALALGADAGPAARAFVQGFATA